MAAWLTVRGREFIGGRELLAFDTWSDEISWRDHKGHHDSTHRPDLVGIRLDGRPIAVEVELAPKSVERLRAILCRHAVWRASGKTNGVYYICGDEDGRQRIKKAAKTGRTFTSDALGLTVELLDTIKEQAIEMREADPMRSGSAATPPDPAAGRRRRAVRRSAEPLDQLARRHDIYAGLVGFDRE